MSKWLAIVKLPNESEKEFELGPGFTFGRNRKCGCVIEDRTVSGEHAIVVEKDGRLHIRDKGSSNHTVILNGPTLDRDQDHPLGPGMVVLLGKTRITFLLEGQEGPDPALEATLGVQTAPSIMPTLNVTSPIVPVSPPSAPLPSDKGTVLASERSEARTAPRAGASPVLEGAETTPAAETMPRVAAPSNERRPSGEQEAVARPEARPAPPPATPAPRAAAPAPPPAAAPAPAPTPAPAMPAKNFSGRDGSSWATIPQVGAGTLDRVAQGAHLAAARPRLVLDDQAQRRVIDITQPEFVVGRSKECEAIGCRIDHRGVSSRQARIYLEGSRFYVEDLESMNGTYADVEQVRIQRREIRSETYLRFGSVSALFVADLDVNGNPVPSDSHERAARMLKHQKRVTKSQLANAEEAARREKRHVGEMLIVQGVIDAFTWAEVYQKTRWMPDVPGGSSKAWLWVAAAVALAGGAVAWWLL